MNYKSKKITKLICPIVCITFFSVWGWNRYQEWQIRKNEFCVHEILRNICDEQWLYGKNADEFLDFKQLREVTKNELLQKLTEHINNGVVTRHGHNFCIYLLSGKNNIYIEGSGSTPKNKNFICYAWPVKYGQTGTRAHAIDYVGWLYTSGNFKQKYSGKKKPSAKACLRKKGIVCNDGETWVTAGTDFWIEHNKQKQWFTCD